jgi:tetratricopeptide (TPR) repeat protein
MKKIITLILLLFILYLPTSACFNEMRVLLNGKQIETSGVEEIPFGRDFAAEAVYYKKQLKAMDSLWKTNHDIDAYSDYGIILIYLGRHKEAKIVFEEIEKINPGRYSTAANIGTLFELLGDNASALFWIKKAVEINPSSHHNSEWIHIKILEAKIKGDEFLNSDFLIGTDFGSEVIPVSTKSNQELLELRAALYFQLSERMSFIKPKDKIVGLLLFELGNIYALISDVTVSLRTYDKAIEYGYSSELLDKRYKKFKSMHAGVDNEYGDAVDKENIQAASNSNMALIMIPVLALIIAAVVILLMKHQK